MKSKRKENGGIAYDLQCYANGEYLDVYSSPEDRIWKKIALGLERPERLLSQHHRLSIILILIVVNRVCFLL